jgi:histone acetyltransferase (RNA polymerase elongator complex component)
MKPVIVPFFIAHQGCPHTCIFCNQVKISGAAETLPSPAELLDRIAVYRGTAGKRGLEAAFYGGTFTSLPVPLQESLLAPLQPLIEKGDLAAVRVSTRPDAVDRETAEFLKNRGVRTVELGVQSLDDTVLARAGRGHTARAVEDACRILVESGMRVGLQLMPGLPGDSPAQALATLRRAIGLGPDFLRIYPTLVIAGTELERLYRAGDYAPMPLSGAISLCKVMLHEALKAAIPVIRIGLLATGELRAGDGVVAGPYHPAFRQVVEAELFYDLMAKLTADVPPETRVILSCSPARVSDVAGQRRANVLRLRSTRGIEITAIKADPCLSPLELRMETDTLLRMGTMLHDLNYAGEDASHAC